jgi:putative redox protein
MALAELGLTDTQVVVTVSLEREEATTRFHYDVALEPAVEQTQRRFLMERIERSPVRQTLSKSLLFAPAGDHG